jgi:hypothetical protein
MAKKNESQETKAEGTLDLRIKAAKLRQPVMLKHWAAT